MQLVVVEGVEPAEVARAVDAQTYARGLLYAQRRDVVRRSGTRRSVHTRWCGTARPSARWSRTSSRTVRG